MHPGPQVVTRAGFGAVKCQNHRHRHPLPVVIHGTKVNKLIIGFFLLLVVAQLGANISTVSGANTRNFFHLPSPSPDYSFCP